MLRFLRKEPLRGAAILSALASLVKLAAYIHSGSLIVLWSLLDSIGDSVISGINYRVEKLSNCDADRQHPFGHGGFEVISGLIQAVVITASAGFIAINGIERVFGSHAIAHNLFESTIVMIAAAFVGLGIGLFLESGKRKKESLSIETDKAHYLVDFWVNALSAVGLILVMVTEIESMDAVFAFGAAMLAVKQVLPIYQKSYDSIVQKEIDVELQKTVVELILASDPLVRGVHRLRSRRLGSIPYIDFHLALPNNIELRKAHQVSDRVELAIKGKFPEMDVLIHIDPESHPDELDWHPSYDM